MGAIKLGLNNTSLQGMGGLRTGHVEEHSRARAISNAPH